MVRYVLKCALLVTLASLCAARIVPIHIQTSKSVEFIDGTFASITIDADKVGQPNYALNVTAPAWTTYARGLAPAICRIGGTDADFINYSMTTQRSVGAQAPQHTMHKEDFDAVNAFAKRVGWKIVFGINDQAGYNSSSAHTWDPSNAETLFKYTADNADNLVTIGWELGNEPALHNDGKSFEPQQLAQDYHTFTKTALPSAFASLGNGTSASPWLMGPDVTPNAFARYSRAGFAREFFGNLTQLGVCLDVITWHYYYPRTPTLNWTEFGTVAELDDFVNISATFVEQIADYRKACNNKPQLWLGETGNPLLVGGSQVPDTFGVFIMHIDKLSIAARRGHAVVNRQQFSILLNRTKTSDPVPPASPGYWAIFAFKQIVGTATVVEVEGDLALGRDVRTYAFCSQVALQAVLVIINLNNTANTVQLPADLASVAALSYTFQAAPRSDDLASEAMTCNGQLLQLVDEHTLPHLQEEALRPSATVQLLPYAVKMLKFEHSWPACSRGDQS